MKNYRLSSYTIPVKLDCEENKFMLIHSYTGAIDVINNQLLEFLKDREFITLEGFPFSNQTFATLVKRGYLTVKTLVEERDLVRKIAQSIHDTRKQGKKKFLFLTTYNCNFRCPYCYENDISCEGSQWSKKVFTKELVDKAYQTMLDIEPLKKDKHIKRIVLYGGEPLLSENKDIVEYIVNKGSELGYTFHAITNGYDLDKFEGLLQQEKLNKLQITLDGVKKTHDSRRFHHEKGDSYEIIMRNIRLALDNGVFVTVRMNIDKYNYGSLDEVKNEFKEAGFYSFKNFSFNPALLEENATSENNPINLNDVNNKDIAYLDKNEFSNLIQDDLSSENGDIYFDYILKALTKNMALSFRPVYCGAHEGMYIFDPFGEIYTCWEMVGKKEYTVGTYNKNLKINNVEMELWHAKNIGNKAGCKNCVYSLICGGGCTAKLELKGKSYKQMYCSSFPSVFMKSANKAYKAYKESQNEAAKQVALSY